MRALMGLRGQHPIDHQAGKTIVAHTATGPGNKCKSEKSAKDAHETGRTANARDRQTTMEWGPRRGTGRNPCDHQQGEEFPEGGWRA